MKYLQVGIYSEEKRHLPENKQPQQKVQLHCEVVIFRNWKDFFVHFPAGFGNWGLEKIGVLNFSVYKYV